jgi:hypothetical protein
MPSKSFTRNLILVEVLSEDPLDDGIGLPDIVREGYEGDFSISWDFVNLNQAITPELTAQLLLDQGSDPEFFGLNLDGTIRDELLDVGDSVNVEARHGDDFTDFMGIIVKVKARTYLVQDQDEDVFEVRHWQTCLDD